MKTSGTLTFTTTAFSVEIIIACKVKDTETITNPPDGGPGTDEITEFKLSGCTSNVEGAYCKAKQIEVVAVNIPWASELISGPPVRDEAQRGLVRGRKSKKERTLETATGALTPEVGNSVLAFAPGSGALEGPYGSVIVSGTDKLTGPPKDKKITAH